MDTRRSAKVAVIGAGISGLVSAWKLQREDKCVTLYEPGKLGGVLQTRISRGFTLETGPNVFAAKKDFLAFLDGIDLTPEIVWPALDRYKQYVWFNGKPNPVPRTLSGFISTSLIASIDKLRLPFRIARKPRLDRAFDDQSISDFFEPLLGQHAVRALCSLVSGGVAMRDIVSGSLCVDGPKATNDALFCCAVVIKGWWNVYGSVSPRLLWLTMP